jgi:hypothetical protein
MLYSVGHAALPFTANTLQEIARVTHPAHDKRGMLFFL